MGVRERKLMDGRAALGSIVFDLATRESAALSRAGALTRTVADRVRDMSLTRQALRTARRARDQFVRDRSLGRDGEGAAVGFEAVVRSYDRAVGLMRAKREAGPLATALREQAALYMAVGTEEGRAAALRCWRDAVDAAFDTYDAMGRWRDVLGGLSPDALSALGAGRAIAPALALVQIARHAPRAAGAPLSAAGAQSGGEDADAAPPAAGADAALEAALFAAASLRLLFTASPAAPARPVDFGRYRAGELAPGIDAFADAAAAGGAGGAVVSALRDAGALLLGYGDAFAEAAMPLLAALEHVAVDRLADVSRTVDARLLRVEALAAVGDITGACDTLAGVLRGAGLPHVGAVSPAPAAGAAAPAGAGAGAAAGAAAGGWRVGPELPRYANHLPPTAPGNRAALRWVCDAAAAALPPPLAAACGELLCARVTAARAAVALAACGDPFIAAPPPPPAHWGDAEAPPRGGAAAAAPPVAVAAVAAPAGGKGAPAAGGAAAPAAPAVAMGQQVGPKPSDADAAWGGADGGTLATAVWDGVDAQLAATAAAMDALIDPAAAAAAAAAAATAAAAAGGKGGDKGKPAAKPPAGTAAAAGAATAALTSGSASARGADALATAPRPALNARAALGAARARVALARGAFRVAAAAAADATRVFTRGRSDGGGAAGGAAAAAADDDEGEWGGAEGRRVLGFTTGFPFWAGLRALTARALLAAGAPRAATEVADAALREARVAGARVAGGRLLLLAAECATARGDVATARAALDVVAGTPPAGGGGGGGARDPVDGLAVASALVARAKLDAALAVGAPPDEAPAAADTAVALARAERLVLSRAITLGFRADAVDAASRAAGAPPAPMSDSLYLPTTPALADVRAALGVALARAAAGSPAGAPAGRALRGRAAAKLSQARATLRHAPGDPRARAAVLLALGRVRRERLVAGDVAAEPPGGDAAAAAGAVAPPGTDAAAALPPSHPFRCAADPLLCSLEAAWASCSHDYAAMRAAACELSVLYAAGLVPRLRARHAQLAAHYVGVAAAAVRAGRALWREGDEIGRGAGGALPEGSLPPPVEAELRAQARIAAAAAAAALAGAKAEEGEAPGGAGAAVLAAAEAAPDAIGARAALRLLAALAREGAVSGALPPGREAGTCARLTALSFQLHRCARAGRRRQRRREARCV